MTILCSLGYLMFKKCAHLAQTWMVCRHGAMRVKPTEDGAGEMKLERHGVRRQPVAAIGSGVTKIEDLARLLGWGRQRVGASWVVAIPPG